MISSLTSDHSLNTTVQTLIILPPQIVPFKPAIYITYYKVQGINSLFVFIPLRNFLPLPSHKSGTCSYDSREIAENDKLINTNPIKKKIQFVSYNCIDLDIAT